MEPAAAMAASRANMDKGHFRVDVLARAVRTLKVSHSLTHSRTQPHGAGFVPCGGARVRAKSLAGE